MGDSGPSILMNYFPEIDEPRWNRYCTLASLYGEWNPKINLISRKDIGSLYEKHVLHSLSIAAVVTFREDMRVLDIGTGGGFPGIPLAIFFPETHFTLLDATGKKIRAVAAIAKTLGLERVTAVHSRVEDLPIQKFDFVVSRAVASLNQLWHWSQPLLSPGTQAGLPNGLICMKGGNLRSEIAESNCLPRQIPVHDLFPRVYFQDKYLLHCPA